MDIQARRKRLLQNIEQRGSMLVAFSGGVDSSLLAVLAQKALGKKSRCVFLDSPVVPAKLSLKRGLSQRSITLTLRSCRLM